MAEKLDLEAMAARAGINIRAYAGLTVANLERFARELEAAQQARGEPVAWANQDTLRAVQDGNIGYVGSRQSITKDGFPLYRDAGVASVPEDVARDAERWRKTLRSVGARYDGGGRPFFTLNYLLSVGAGNLMKGSVAEHFTNAIDATIAASKEQTPDD